MLVKMNATPVTVNIIQIYAPTTACDEEDLEEFYDDLNKAMKMCKNREATIIMGDRFFTCTQFSTCALKE